MDNSTDKTNPNPDEQPKKVNVELNLEELDNVSGGGAIGGATSTSTTSVSTPRPGLYQIEAI